MKRESYRLNKDIFIQRSNNVHGGKYDYSKVLYKNHRTKVTIICPIHGEFTQTPKNHMKGQGCPECGKKYAQEWQKGNYDALIQSSKERFGDKYDFPNIENEYVNSHSVITILCNTCGSMFQKIACDHITSPNGGCRHCAAGSSKPEEEIGDFVIANLPKNTSVIFNSRRILKGNEIDIFIPSKKIAIEFNGLYWHSNKNKNYHLMKTEACAERGVCLVQIFEDEYKYHKDIVFSKLRHLLGNNYDLPKIYGRKCIVQEIAFKDASSFLNKNHLQGVHKSTVYLGAYCNDELVGVMSFTKENDNSWELTRFATDITKRAIGVGGKMFSYFVKEYDPEKIKSFADRRWTTNASNNLYHHLGFELDKILKPDYRYFMEGETERIHKFRLRKKIINKKFDLPMDLTESQMAEIIGARRIWDCGLYRYIWTKNK